MQPEQSHRDSRCDADRRLGLQPQQCRRFDAPYDRFFDDQSLKRFMLHGRIFRRRDGTSSVNIFLARLVTIFIICLSFCLTTFRWFSTTIQNGRNRSTCCPYHHQYFPGFEYRVYGIENLGESDSVQQRSKMG